MTPTGEEQVFDDDTLVGNGWFPAANLAGIACEYAFITGTRSFARLRTRI